MVEKIMVIWLVALFISIMIPVQIVAGTIISACENYQQTTLRAENQANLSAIKDIKQGSLRITQINYHRDNDSVTGYFTLRQPGGAFVDQLSDRDFYVKDTDYRIDNFRITRVNSSARPNYVVFVLDISNSVVGSPLLEALSGIKSFTSQATGNFHYAGVVFAGQTAATGGFSNEQKQFLRQLNVSLESISHDYSSLYDGVYQGINTVSQKDGRRVVIVLSDGGENSSKVSLSQVTALARQTNTSIISIGVPGTTFEETTMLRLANETGGLYLPSSQDDEIANLYQKTFNQLEEEYQIDYKLPALTSYWDDKRNMYLELKGYPSLYGLKTYKAQGHTAWLPKYRDTFNWNTKISPTTIPKPTPKPPTTDYAVKDIKYLTVNNEGTITENGPNHVIIINPQAKNIDFKVNVAMKNKIYEKDNQGNYKKEYVGKHFTTLVTEDNGKLENLSPFAAINADYVETNNGIPQGLNISRGVEYSGNFKDSRSSFAIGKQGQLSIQVGKKSDDLNFNTVGGNGRTFVSKGFNNHLCDDIGDFSCHSNDKRSMVSLTTGSYIILLVNNSYSAVGINFFSSALHIENIERVMKRVAANYNLGDITDGLLFDGGGSPGMYYNGTTLVENKNPIGSVLLIYKN